MEIEIVICKSSHHSQERKELQEELKNADFFVPEFFQSQIINIDYNALKKLDEEKYNMYLPAERIKEAYEKAKEKNNKLNILEDEEAQDYFLNTLSSIDEAEDIIRKQLYSLAYIFPLTTINDEITYKKYKESIPDLLNKMKKYIEVNNFLEDKFCEFLAKKLKYEIDKAKNKKLKIVIDSGYIHQYNTLEDWIQKEIKGAIIKIREVINPKTIHGFLEDLILELRKGKLNEKNIEKYTNEFAQSILFEAIYSAYRNEIGGLGINRKKQEEVYNEYIPKVAKWGEKELKKFWTALKKCLLQNPSLRPYLYEEDLKKVLKEARLDY